jgi:hypothetical protein
MTVSIKLCVCVCVCVCVCKNRAKWAEDSADLCRFIGNVMVVSVAQAGAERNRKPATSAGSYLGVYLTHKSFSAHSLLPG